MEKNRQTFPYSMIINRFHGWKVGDEARERKKRMKSSLWTVLLRQYKLHVNMFILTIWFQEFRKLEKYICVYWQYDSWNSGNWRNMFILTIWFLEFRKLETYVYIDNMIPRIQETGEICLYWQYDSWNSRNWRNMFILTIQFQEFRKLEKYVYTENMIPGIQETGEICLYWLYNSRNSRN